TITVSFLSGIYPAFVLSRFKPVSVLKNQTSISTRQPRQTQIRKILTVSQFVVAQFFIIATIIVSKQVNYSINTDMGFNKDAVVNFDLPRDFKESQRTTLLNEMKSIPGVELASTGFFAPADKGVAVTIVEYNDG